MNTLDIPLKIPFSDSMIQKVLPEVGGESVRGLC